MRQVRHGSAPDIAGRNVANPLAVPLMLQDLGEAAAADAIEHAAEGVLADGTVRTPDLGGNSSTCELGGQVVSAIERRSA
jgi:tartrate dehydrogenase/decarboxylase/D-malate dehydrogenase